MKIQLIKIRGMQKTLLRLKFIELKAVEKIKLIYFFEMINKINEPFAGLTNRYLYLHLSSRMWII